MTFEEAHELLLKELQVDFERLLGIHRDSTFINSKSDEYTDLLKYIGETSEAIFDLKQIEKRINDTKVYVSSFAED